MGILDRLFRKAATEPTLVVRVLALEDTEDLAEVSVGRVTIPASIYWNREGSSGDSYSGIRLQDPRTGQAGDDNLPDELLAAGARWLEVRAPALLEDAQADAFGLGHPVRLVASPDGAGPGGIAIRSADGRLVAGHVPDDDLDRVRSTTPTPQTGMVVWELLSAPPRRRIAIHLLVGRSVELRVIPDADQEPERARRNARYEAGLAEQATEYDRWRAEFHREREARRVEREREKAAEHGRRATLEAERRAAGVCLDCGGPIERPQGRGRPPVRCVACRAHAAG